MASSVGEHAGSERRESGVAEGGSGVLSEKSRMSAILGQLNKLQLLPDQVSQHMVDLWVVCACVCDTDTCNV